MIWNRAINLTTIVEPEAVATLHVADSLTALPLVAAHRLDGQSLRLLDLGSGGGFPGLPLAAALPEARVDLVESVGKKARFLATVVAATGLGERVEVVAARAEEVAASVAAGTRPPADVVTARAVASLAELIELSMPLLEIGGSLLAWKRGAIDAELAAGARAARVVGAGTPVVHPAGMHLLHGHAIVSVTKRARTPDGYPREPAARRRRPW